MERLDWLTYDTFSPYIDSTFDVQAGPDRVPLVLIEATQGAGDGGIGPDGKVRKQFALSFRGPSLPALEQATYAVTHSQIGEFLLFLVPVGNDANGLLYEAVFN